jgi:hypothetical protein
VADVLTVCAIIGLVVGLACLRALFWIRRVRVLTQVGRDLHVADHPSGGSHHRPIGE